jgi:hypothetical protein
LQFAKSDSESLFSNLAASDDKNSETEMSDEELGSWVDVSTKKALQDGGLWAGAGTREELIYQERANSLWIDVNGDPKKFYEGMQKIGDEAGLVFDIVTFPMGLGALSVKTGVKAGQYVIRSRLSFANKVVDSAKIKRAENYKKFSPNWSKGSLKDGHEKFTPNAEGVLSKDGVKTRYTSDSHTIIKDNENNYFRIYDNTRKQYVSPNGKPPPTGGLKGKEAKDHMQKQTHLRNTD